ncbi:MAG: nucleoside triphosphate hydrolase [Pseudomonadota bacterium]
MTQRFAITEFIAEIRGWALALPVGSRRIIAIAGAPGSGKSTLADEIVSVIEAEAPGIAATLPMDGFHYDDEVLVPRGWRPRKGAPHTFDVGGFSALLARLRANSEDEIAVPRFDRDLEIARGAARIVPKSARLVVAEGNYLLLNEPPWTRLTDAFDRTVFLDVPIEELTRRLTERWEGYGLTGEDLREKMEGNDLPNARTVVERSSAADIVVYPELRTQHAHEPPLSS